MNVLVVGGTQFIGRHLVKCLLKHGHSVTLLNRGKTAPGLYPELPVIIADRQSAELKNAKGLKQNWDAVIDLSAYYPKDVSNLLDILNGHTNRYVFCSTISVYQELMAGTAPLLNEESPMLSCTAAEAIDTSMMTYGKRKAECERLIASHSAKIPFAIIRPSVVFGEFDHTDRFAYWIARASRQKDFILPDDGLTISQKTYAPDLAEAFVAAMTSTAATGHAYNIAETETLNLRDTLSTMGKHLNINSLDYAASIPTTWLEKQNVKPWADLPLWLSKTNMLIDTFNSRRDLGFASTPYSKALADAADAFLKENRAPRTGLSFEAEEKLLSLWNRE